MKMAMVDLIISYFRAGFTRMKGKLELLTLIWCQILFLPSC